MGKQKNTVRNKRKIKVVDYENDVVDTKDTKKQISKTFSRELKITIISIFIVTIVMISSAFAIFSSVQKSEKYNTLTVGTLKVDFIDTEDGMGNIINLNGAYPISDAKGQEEDPYSFKITNSGTLAASYKIKILDDTDMINEDNCQNNLLDKSKVRVSINKGEVFTLSDTEAGEFTVEQGTLEASDVKNYEIRIWIKEDSGNEVLGKHYHGKIVVEGVNTKSATKLCKRATTLHKETCNQTDASKYCTADGYTTGSEIEYGSLGIAGTLTSGDAFDCDVNGDGVYDAATERFYYVSDMTNGITTDNNTAVLVYYNNVSGGVASNSTAYAYDESNENWHGPVTAVKQLPTTSQWKTTLKNTKRQITTETNTTSTSGGTIPEFSYDGYAARLLTAQEVNAGCGFIIGSTNVGELSRQCKYLMENTKYSSDSNKAYGEWLESPRTGDSNLVWYVDGYDRYVSNNYTINSDINGVKPAIEIAKSNISY